MDNTTLSLPQTSQQPPQGKRARAQRYRAPGAIFGILIVMTGALFMRSSFAVHAAPRTLAQNQVLTLPIVTNSDPTLDAGNLTDATSYTVVSMMQVGMIGLNNGSPSPRPETITRLPTLANGDISPDGLTYTFHIKPSLTFSNGDPLNAETFAYTLERSMTWEVGRSRFAPAYLNELKGAAAYMQANYASGDALPPLPSISPTDPVNGIEGPGRAISVLNPNTLVLTLQTPEAPTLFFEQLSFPLAWAVDQAYDPANPFLPGQSGSNFHADWANANATAIPASGPFMINAFTSTQSIMMIPNPNWSGAPLTLTQVTIPFVSTEPAAFDGYQANLYDIAPVDIGDIPTARTLPTGEFHQAKFLENFYVAMNWLDPFFKDQLVRQAFAETIDRPALARSVLGSSVIPSEHFVPQGMPGYNANLQGFGFNPVDARAKLQQAEQQDQVTPPATIVFSYPPLSVAQDTLVSVMINDWKLYLGVTVVANPEPFGQLLTDLKNNAGQDNVQMYMLGWVADYPDPQDFLSVLWGPNAAASGVNGNNENATDAWAILAQADVDQNTTERYTLYNQAEQLLVNDVAGTELYQTVHSYVVKPWVSGYNLQTYVFEPNAWANVQILAH